MEPTIPETVVIDPQDADQLVTAKNKQYMIIAAVITVLVVALVGIVLIVQSRGQARNNNNVVSNPVSNSQGVKPGNVPPPQEQDPWENYDFAAAMLTEGIIPETTSAADKLRINEAVRTANLRVDLDNNGDEELVAPLDGGGTTGIVSYSLFKLVYGQPILVDSLDMINGKPSIEGKKFINEAPYLQEDDQPSNASAVFIETYGYKDNQFNLESRKLTKLYDYKASKYITPASNIAVDPDSDFIDTCKRYIFGKFRSLGEAKVTEREDNLGYCVGTIQFGDASEELLTLAYDNAANYVGTSRGVTSTPAGKFTCYNNSTKPSEIGCVWTRNDQPFAVITYQAPQAQATGGAKLDQYLKAIVAY